MISFLRCSVCGRKMPLQQVVKQRFGPALSYPTRTTEGSRVETTVSRLCDECDQRANQHRQEQPGEATFRKGNTP